MVDLSLDAVALVVAAVGGVYAVRAFLLLYRNQEMFRIQRGIWSPILYAGGFLVLDRLLHLGADLVPYTLPSDILDILHTLFVIVSLTLLSLGIFRYWGLQKEYEAKKSATGGRVAETA